MSLSAKSVAVVTGAASGIGRALAIKLAEEKIAGIAISDVNEAGLSETADLAGAAGVPISTHIIDVSKIDQVQRLADEAVAAHGGVTHLINNAGVGVLGNFEQLSIEDFEWLMSINFWGVIYGCKVFLPILRQQESAHILNVSSVFGFIAPEEQSAYCLRHELAGTNVTVSAIHPGGIKTNIARNSRVGKDTPEDWKQQGAKFFDKVARTSPETAADVIVKGIKAKNPRILIGQDAYAISTISRLFPKRYLRLLERLSGHKMSLRKK